ncbi:conserved hypothetical protein [Hyphomicrobiales bacterium]|nr:conserved hypothetical protein [Hyphomicrobiales bacterium]CAH1698019.1 conserved hypothetical protein [Hyphomicrobiales bacterium]CAI0347662.1 DUF3800 domain-containing protein [Hyphomicrobiales bacterium]
MPEYSFVFCVDEAGDDGIERVRPLDEDGASEYFVMAGVLYSAHRNQEIVSFVSSLKKKIGINFHDTIHFRDLDDNYKNIILSDIANFKIGIVCVVSNKRNMRGYRNRRVEERSSMYRNGRKFVPKINWFYNNILRYLIESATEECSRLNNIHYSGKDRKLKTIIEYRKGFSYTQTRNYLRKLEIESRPRSYFNSKRRPIFSVLDIDGLEGVRSSQHAGLQLADCVASAIYQAIDHDRFKILKTEYIAALMPRFIKRGGEIKGYGFKLLPEPFGAPLTLEQKTILRALGYR